MGNLSLNLRARARRFQEVNIFLFLLPPESDMDLKKLATLSTAQLADLYNDLSEKAVKRFATRKDAERRTIEALKAKGKWKEDAPAAPAPDEAAPEDAPKAKGSRRKAAEKPATPQPVPKTGERTGKGQKAAPSPKEKPDSKESAGRGAPTKNQTYTAIPESDKKYNPRGFRMNSTSDRAVVLKYVRDNGGQRTRDEVAGQFPLPKGEERAVNFESALYFLSRYGFLRVGE